MSSVATGSRANRNEPIAADPPDQTGTRGIGSDIISYSYRSDPMVPRFKDDVPLIIFDGQCVLCSSGVAWMVARDPQGVSQFAVIQDVTPQAIYRHYGLDAEQFDTFMVLVHGRPYIKWRGVIEAGRTLPMPWRLLAVAARAVPRVLGDRLYDWIQRNRLDWFGRNAICSRPLPAMAHRYLPGPAGAAKETGS